MANRSKIRALWIILSNSVSNNPPDVFIIFQTLAFQTPKNFGKTIYQNSQVKKKTINKKLANQFIKKALKVVKTLIYFFQSK